MARRPARARGAARQACGWRALLAAALPAVALNAAVPASPLAVTALLGHYGEGRGAMGAYAAANSLFGLAVRTRCACLSVCLSVCLAARPLARSLAFSLAHLVPRAAGDIHMYTYHMGGY